MNHQPFEGWLLEDEDLSQDQKQALQAHLKSCQDCSNIVESWQEVRHVIVATPRATPLPGFTERWQAHLVKRRADQQRRLAWGIFGACLAILIIILGVIYLPSVMHLSFGEILASFLLNVTILFVRINQTREIIELLLGGVSPVFPIIVWILAASSLACLSFIWIAAIWKIIVPKGVRS